MRYSVSKEWRDLENQVRGRSRSLKMAPFDRPYATFYWSAIVNIALSCTIFELLGDISTSIHHVLFLFGGISPAPVNFPWHLLWHNVQIIHCKINNRLTKMLRIKPWTNFKYNEAWNYRKLSFTTFMFLQLKIFKYVNTKQIIILPFKIAQYTWLSGVLKH